MRALLVVAPKNYKDKEYNDTKSVFEDYSIEVVTASKTKQKCKGADGGEVDPDYALKDVKLDDFDAVVFIGGEGSSAYFDDEEALNLVKKSSKTGKVLGAICIAPSILANAGILKGLRATAFDSEKANIEKKGGKFTGAPVETQGAVITANGPEAAEEFADKLALALQSNAIK